MKQLSFYELLRNNRDAGLSALPSYRNLQPLIGGESIDFQLKVFERVSLICGFYNISEEEFSKAAAEICRFDGVPIWEFLTEKYMRAVSRFKRGKKPMREEKTAAEYRSAEGKLSPKILEGTLRYFERHLRSDMLIPGRCDYLKEQQSCAPSDIAAVIFYLIAALDLGEMDAKSFFLKVKRLISTLKRVQKTDGHYPALIGFDGYIALTDYVSSFDGAILTAALRLLGKAVEGVGEQVDLRGVMPGDLLDFFDREKLLFAVGMRNGRPVGHYTMLLQKGLLLNLLTKVTTYGMSNRSDSDESLEVLSPFLAESFFDFAKYNEREGECTERGLLDNGEFCTFKNGILLLNCNRDNVYMRMSLLPPPVKNTEIPDNVPSKAGIKSVGEFTGLKLIALENRVLVYDARGNFALFCNGRVKLPRIVVGEESLSSESDARILAGKGVLTIVRSLDGGRAVVKADINNGFTLSVRCYLKASVRLYFGEENFEISGDAAHVFPWRGVRFFKEQYVEFGRCLETKSACELRFRLPPMQCKGFNGHSEPILLMLAHLCLSGKLPPSGACRAEKLPLKECGAILKTMGLPYSLGEKKQPLFLKEKRDFSCEDGAVTLSVQEAENFLRYAEKSPLPPPFRCVPPLKKRGSVSCAKNYRREFSDAEFKPHEMSAHFAGEAVRFTEVNIRGLEVTVITESGEKLSPFFMHCEDAAEFGFYCDAEKIRYTARSGCFCVGATLGLVSGELFVELLETENVTVCGQLIVKKGESLYRRLDFHVRGGEKNFTFPCYPPREKYDKLLEVAGLFKPFSRAVCGAANALARDLNDARLSRAQRIFSGWLLAPLLPEYAAETAAKGFLTARGRSEGYALSILCCRAAESLGMEVFERSTGGKKLSEYVLSAVNARSQTPLQRLLKYIALREVMAMDNLVTNRSYVAAGMLRLGERMKKDRPSALMNLIGCLYFKQGKYLGGVIRNVNLRVELRAAAFAACGEGELFEREIKRVKKTPYTLSQFPGTMGLLCSVIHGCFGIRREGDYLTFAPSGAIREGQLKLLGKTRANILLKSGEEKSLPVVPCREKRSVKVVIIA